MCKNEYFTGAMPVTYPKGSFENITRAMDHAHAAGIPVAAIQHTSPAPDAPAFRKGSHGWELHDEIKKRHADIVIEKAHAPTVLPARAFLRGSQRTGLGRSRSRAT